MCSLTSYSSAAENFEIGSSVWGYLFVSLGTLLWERAKPHFPCARYVYKDKHPLGLLACTYRSQQALWIFTMHLECSYFFSLTHTIKWLSTNTRKHLSNMECGHFRWVLLAQQACQFTGIYLLTKTIAKLTTPPPLIFWKVNTVS